MRQRMVNAAACGAARAVLRAARIGAMRFACAGARRRA